MNDKNHIKKVLLRSGCSRAPTLESIITDLGVNSKYSTMMAYKHVIKKIKKWLSSLAGSIVNTTNQVCCGLQTMQAIDFPSRTVQDIANHGLTLNVTLLNEIDT